MHHFRLVVEMSEIIRPVLTVVFAWNIITLCSTLLIGQTLMVQLVYSAPFQSYHFVEISYFFFFLRWILEKCIGEFCNDNDYNRGIAGFDRPDFNHLWNLWQNCLWIRRNQRHYESIQMVFIPNESAKNSADDSDSCSTTGQHQLLWQYPMQSWDF